MGGEGVALDGPSFACRGARRRLGRAIERFEEAARAGGRLAVLCEEAFVRPRAGTLFQVDRGVAGACDLGAGSIVEDAWRQEGA